VSGSLVVGLLMLVYVCGRNMGWEYSVGPVYCCTRVSRLAFDMHSVIARSDGSHEIRPSRPRHDELREV